MIMEHHIYHIALIKSGLLVKSSGRYELLTDEGKKQAFTET